MKHPLSSFIVHLSSFALLLAIGNQAIAQTWIIDGQQVQTLNLNVSDPQALYTDGSREMTAPIYFPPSLTATSGLFRVYYAPEGRTEEFFIINGADEYVQLSSGCGTFRVGDTFVHGGGLYSGLNSAAISFDEKLLSGGWKVEDVPDHSGAVMSRSYADARYLRQGVDLTAPLAFASSYTATGGMFRAYIPWAEDNEFFIIDGNEEVLKLSSSDAIGFQIGAMILNQAGIFQTSEGTGIDFGEHMLSGGWQIDEVLPYPEAVISRGFADGKYMIAGETATQPIKFSQSLTATNGALQIYTTDNEDYAGYFKSLSFQDGLQFSTMHSASLFFGMNSNDGLLIGPDSIMQLGYNARIEFETGTLKGVYGAKQWHVSEDPTEASGIVNRGYADSRYLRSDIDLTAPLTFALGSGTPANPVIRMHIPVMGSGLRDCFYFDENDEGIRLCDEPVALLIDELRVESENISLGSKQIGMDTGRFYGDWETMSVPDSNFAIMNRSYTDTRYLKRTEGITTNRVIQAGDTLVISNGLITAINP